MILGNSRQVASPVAPFSTPVGAERMIAHRGFSGRYPENTRSAFDAAWNSGARVLETDVQVSADGEAICFHDDRLQRMTGWEGTPSDYTFAELQQAVVRGPNETVGEILSMADLLGSFSNAHFIVDLKDDRAIEPLARAILKTNSAQRVCVTHAWDAWLEAVREIVGPALQRGLGWETMAALVNAARRGVSPDPAIRVANYAHIGWQIAGINLAADQAFFRRYVEMAHDLGMAVRVWTINSPRQMARLFDDGADAIFTDHVDVGLKVVADRFGI